MLDPRAPQPPALARAGIDRAGAERDEPGLLDRLRTDPATRVVAVHGDRSLIADSGTALRTVSAVQIRPDAAWALLGRGAEGEGVLLAASADDAPDPLAEPVPDARWAALRVVGGELDAVEAGLFVEAAALGRWLVDAPFCPACGMPTSLETAGWSRRCTGCGRQHFPRTDPAVIVAVQSADGDRLLLGQNALWASRGMYSTFAGFVEAGESLESTIGREVLEEAGVVIAESRYRGSQAWPYPRSLMLGFHATATPDSVARADGEEIVEVRWFERAELAAALADPDGDGIDFRLPGTASIARRLIVDWVESAP
ncbi:MULTISPECIES: NAD(+) diphosphatase [unclassified Microbacterium]|uniref:NAD(+) diphosphatase n=1 Tax=unclassified Microbacterium TaxID=2609290 RepID=UPI0030169291